MYAGYVARSISCKPKVAILLPLAQSSTSPGDSYVDIGDEVCFSVTFLPRIKLICLRRIYLFIIASSRFNTTSAETKYGWSNFHSFVCSKRNDISIGNGDCYSHEEYDIIRSHKAAWKNALYTNELNNTWNDLPVLISNFKLARICWTQRGIRVTTKCEGLGWRT